MAYAEILKKFNLCFSMKNIIYLSALVSLLWLSPLQASAQFSHGPIIYAGYGFNGFHTGTLNNFIQSYNTYYTIGLKEALPEYSFSNMHGFNLGMGYRYMSREKSGFVGSFMYQYGYAGNKKRSRIWNNSGSEMHLQFHTHNILFEAGYQVKGIFFMQGILGFMIRDVNLPFRTVYPDGSVSMGNEYDINGFYKVSTNSLLLGGSLGFRYWHFFFPVRIYYGIPLFTDRLPLIDYDAFRFRQNEFPNDFNVFVNDVSGTQFETNIVPQEDFMGLGLQFGIEFMIPIIKN